jgi:HAMP domain-containing protein
MLQIYQKMLDDVTPYAMARWLFAAVLTLAFLARVFLLQVCSLFAERSRYRNSSACNLLNVNSFT